MTVITAGGYSGTAKRSRGPLILIFLVLLILASMFYLFSGSFGDPGDFQKCLTPQEHKLRATESVEVIQRGPSRLVLQLRDEGTLVSTITYILKQYGSYTVWEANAWTDPLLTNRGYGTRLLFEGDRVLGKEYGKGFYRLVNTEKYSFSRFLGARPKPIEQTGRLTLYYCP